MSNEVKRYDPINSDGTCGMCIEDADYGAYVEYADYAALEAELATVKKVAYGNMELLEENAKLRAELERRAVDGFVLVPVEPTPEMVSAAEEAHMPFGDMDIALRMAILSAHSAPATVQGDEYRCRKCGENTPPPEPYKAYVLCDCGYMTSATAAIAAARQEGKV